MKTSTPNCAIEKFHMETLQKCWENWKGKQKKPRQLLSNIRRLPLPRGLMQQRQEVFSDPKGGSHTVGTRITYTPLYILKLLLNNLQLTIHSDREQQFCGWPKHLKNRLICNYYFNSHFTSLIRLNNIGNMERITHCG